MISTSAQTFRISRDGVCIEEPTDILAFWREDLVAFVIGCSSSSEAALMEEGVPLHHIERDTVVPMYRSSIACAPAGAFIGPMVVSMRVMIPANAIRAVQVTTRYSSVHGAPVHIGVPEAIGIADLMKTDYGDPPPVVEPGLLPVFWACGVTPQSVVLNKAVTLHHPQAGLDADYRSPQPGTRDILNSKNNLGR